MKTSAQAIKARSAAQLAAVAGTRTALARIGLADYWELTKPEVTFLVVTTALAGFYLGARGALDWFRLLHTLVGTALVAAGTATLNQLFERDVDARMRRTAQRPLPAGRLKPSQALAFGVALAVVGGLELAVAVNLLSSFLALFTLASYLLLYTPLKKKTNLCTVVGAFPGAMPVLIGWVASGRELEPAAWILYAILFLWQFPHFLAIAWLYREDYARGGIVMLPPRDTYGKFTARQIVFFSLALLPATMAPALLGLAGRVYLLGALVLGFGFLYFAVRLARSRTLLEAKWLLHASVIYLPLLYGLMMLDKIRL